MPINAIRSPATNNINPAATTASVQASLAALQEEANESPATTRQEAAQGDAVARRKLARQQQTHPVQAPPSEPGKGELINHTA